MPWCRAAQQEAEAAAAEESQRLRRLAAQEAHLKETFLEAVEAEKERLLLAREREKDRGVQGKTAVAPQARLVHLHMVQYSEHSCSSETAHCKADQLKSELVTLQPFSRSWGFRSSVCFQTSD